jgi:23S rRNA pseudouridine2604 synthase
MNITLEGIGIGKWRYLTKNEIDTIQKMVATSVKTQEASMLEDE